MSGIISALRCSVAARIWCLLACILAGVLCWQIPQVLHAVRDSRIAVTSLKDCEQLARHTLALREASPVIALASDHDETRLINHVTSCLSRAGVASSAVTAVTPEGTRTETFNAVRYQRSRARVTLAAVTLPQLGDFLSTWRVQQPRWMIDSIQLDPQPVDASKLPKASSGQSTLARPLNITLTMESLALAAETPP